MSAREVLAGMRERAEAVRATQATTPEGMVARAAVVNAAPALVGALEAVVAIHREIDDGRGPHCFEDAEDWPCPTVRAIETAMEPR